MKIRKSAAILTGMLALLAGCATTPTGPRVSALPGTGKSFDQFRYDDTNCRRYARDRVADAGDSGVGSAVAGTAIGAIAGGAIGGQSGAAVGAGTGLIVGSAVGAEHANASAYGKQRQYDDAYTQCMYAKGQRVPVAASAVQQAPPPGPVTPPANYSPPYPPPPPPNWR